MSSDEPRVHNLGIADTLFTNEGDHKVVTGITSLSTAITGALPEYVQLLISLVWEILLWLSFPARMVIRKDFGIREVTFVRYLGASFFVGLGRTTLNLIFGFGTLGWYWSFMVTCFFGWNWWNTQRKFKRGERWHSRSNGISRLWWIVEWGQERELPFFHRIDDVFLGRFVEPALFIVIGLILRPFDIGLSWLITLTAFSLYITSNHVHNKMKNQLLDFIDAGIEADNFQMAIGGAPKNKTEGFQVLQPPAMYFEQAKKVQERRSKISPDYSPTVEETLGAVSAS